MAIGSLGFSAPTQRAAVPTIVNLAQETVIAGAAYAGDAPISGGYARLIDAEGEFAAEVVTSVAGQFRFFAAPGSWTVRVLSWFGDGEATVTVGRGITEIVVTVE